MSLIQNYKLLCDKLSSEAKLTRERELVNFKEFILNNDVHLLDDYIKYNLSNLNNDHWPVLLGNLTAIYYILNNQSCSLSPQLLNDVKIKCFQLLSFDEHRVRLCAGEVLSKLFKHFGKEHMEEYRNLLLNLLQDNINEDNKSRDPSRLSFNFPDSVKTPFSESIESPPSPSILQLTSGWKRLETSIKYMEIFLKQNPDFQNDFINNELINLYLLTFPNPNRFVRESSFQALTIIFLNDNIDTNSLIRKKIDQFADILSTGMCDNWSQVKYGSLQATKAFLLSYLQTEEQRNLFYPNLLPKICLNRYYLAEGVKLYAQEMWKKITNDEGKKMVQKYLVNFVTYYIEATRAENHAVREAGCHSIAELANKIDSQLLQPYALELIDVLIHCFKDDSWPVRDTACLASGSFIMKFPEDTRAYMDQFYPFLFQNLGDPIPSVRQGAALSLSKVASAYGQPCMDILEERIVKSFADVDKQKPDDYTEINVKKNSRSQSPVFSHENSNLGNRDTTQTSLFGVTVNHYTRGKDSLDNDPKHTDQTMYSCGSLAPKMKARGCHDTGFQRPSDYWEIADGCLYLLSELVKNDPGQLVIELLERVFPLLLRTTQKRHYPQHVQLLDNFLIQLPVIIGSGISKQCFKTNLEPVIEDIFYALHSDSIQLKHDAVIALRCIAKYLGPNILRGRIENYNPEYLREYDNLGD